MCCLRRRPLRQQLSVKIMPTRSRYSCLWHYFPMLPFFFTCKLSSILRTRVMAQLPSVWVPTTILMHVLCLHCRSFFCPTPLVGPKTVSSTPFLHYVNNVIKLSFPLKLQISEQILYKVISSTPHLRLTVLLFPCFWSVTLDRSIKAGPLESFFHATFCLYNIT